MSKPVTYDPARISAKRIEEMRRSKVYADWRRRKDLAPSLAAAAAMLHAQAKALGSVETDAGCELGRMALAIDAQIAFGQDFDQGPMVATRYATQAEHDKDGAVRVFFQAGDREC